MTLLAQLQTFGGEQAELELPRVRCACGGDENINHSEFVKIGQIPSDWTRVIGRYPPDINNVKIRDIHVLDSN
ncbi:MAG: hypothetical protein LBJ42_00795 [Holosporales bacterium]|nr:hypothetical protein [Holosporales bacterium]